MPDRVAVLRVERKALRDLQSHEAAPRDHPAEGSPAWDTLAKSLEFDYFLPLIWNQRNGKLVAGDLRRKILLSMGFSHADVGVVDYDEETHKARMVAANSHSGDWNNELLVALARDVEKAGLDPALALWKPQDLAALLEGPTIADDGTEAGELVSKAEKLQEKWQVRLGDLFQIGPHRLLCGDCTKLENWHLLLEGRQADMIWTDPPYNVNYDSIQTRRMELLRAKGNTPHTVAEPILNDHMSDAAYAAFLKAAFTAAFSILRPGGACYIAHADSQGLTNRSAAAEAGFHIAQTIVWVKSAFTLGRQDYQWQHEPILYGWKPGAGHYWQGGYRQTTVLDDEIGKLHKKPKNELIAIINDLLNARDTTVTREPRNTGNGLHPTIKPLPLVARQVWNSSRRTETVAEFFSGSGTTLVAAEQTGRRAVATDLEPKFCAVTLERLTAHGLEARLLANHAPAQ